MSLSCRRFSGVKANPAKIPASDFEFSIFLMPLANGQGGRRIMNKASFWVNVAQLAVAILALAVSLVALCKQAPPCPPPPSTHHHRMHHRPPRGGLLGFYF